MKPQRGFSLVELLIAMTLGVFLSGVAVYAYLGAKQASFQDDQVARLHENATYALRLLARELVMAGFRGSAINPIGLEGLQASSGECSTVDWALDWSAPLLFVNNHSGNGAPVTIGGEALQCLADTSPVAGSDLLAVRRSAAEPSAKRGVVASQLTLSSGPTWFLRADDGIARSFETLRPREIPRLAAANRQSSYWEVVSRIYFVRRYSRNEGDELPTLCAKVLAGSVVTTRCFVEGVEQFQLQFGLDVTGDGVVNTYVSSPDAEQLRDAVAARVYVLMRSVDPVRQSGAVRSYDLAGTVLTPEDRRYIRRVFSATVQLRNSPYARG